MSTSPIERQVEFVMRTVEERNIRFVRLWFTDVLGFLKSVAISPAELEAAFEEGIGFFQTQDQPEVAQPGLPPAPIPNPPEAPALKTNP